MSASPLLLGFDRLLKVCQAHQLPLSLTPPRDSAPKAGEPFFGHPFDPMLAAVYQRTGGALLCDLYLGAPGRAWNELHGWNESMKQDAQEPFLSCALFGRVPNLAYYYGTIPALAAEGGLQPVVFIDGHEAPFAIPLASTVDTFFDVYARYIERTLEENAAVGHAHRPWDTPPHRFPWTVPGLFSTDEQLIAQVRAGSFDRLTHEHPDAREWLQRLKCL